MLQPSSVWHSINSHYRRLCRLLEECVQRVAPLKREGRGTGSMFRKMTDPIADASRVALISCNCECNKYCDAPQQTQLLWLQCLMLSARSPPVLPAGLPFLPSNVQPIDAAGWVWVASDCSISGKTVRRQCALTLLCLPPSTLFFLLIYVGSIWVFGLLGKTITFSFASKNLIIIVPHYHPAASSSASFLLLSSSCLVD